MKQLSHLAVFHQLFFVNVHERTRAVWHLPVRHGAIFTHVFVPHSKEIFLDLRHVHVFVYKQRVFFVPHFFLLPLVVVASTYSSINSASSLSHISSCSLSSSSESGMVDLSSVLKIFLLMGKHVREW